MNVSRIFGEVQDIYLFLAYLLKLRLYGLKF